jgi:hypothetical protein
MLRFFFLLLLFPVVVSAQTVQRNKGETDSAFAWRMRPDTCEFEHPVLHGKYGFLTQQEEIIAIYGDSTEYYEYAELFIPKDTLGHYKEISIDTLIPGLCFYPEVLAVFFANADKDKEKELLILYTVCYKEQVEGMPATVTHYLVGVYDNATCKCDQGTCLKKLPIAEKLGSSDVELEGKSFTAADVKKQLKKLGY